MGMDLQIKAFKTNTEHWTAMKAVWDACKEASVTPPADVLKFFNYEEPDSSGIEVSEEDLKECGALSNWGDESKDGFEIDVKKLPPDVATIRFYNNFWGVFSNEQK